MNSTTKVAITPDHMPTNRLMKIFTHRRFLPGKLPASNRSAAKLAGWLLFCLWLMQPAGATPPGTVVAWGSNSNGQTNVPAGLSGVTAIAAGGKHTMALNSDGTVVVWGYNNFGQTNVPSGLNNVTAIAAGDYHTMALKSDGTVVAWGDNNNGQSNIPAGLSGVTAIAAGGWHTMALKSDGAVVVWGYNANGQTNIPAGLSGVTGIAAGQLHTVALLGTPALAPSFIAQPSNQTVAAGQNASFLASASGDPTPTYQWQVSTDGGSNWNNLINDSTFSGVANATLTVAAALIGQNGYRFRAVATNPSGSAISDAAVLTVSAVVSASLTPGSTSSVSITPVVLQVTGLNTGVSVIVERFVDANADGVINTGEFLAERFLVTDGQVTSIDGVRNTNIPGDEDGAADGQISTHLTPALGAELGRLAGQQLIRVSSPIAAFSPLTRTLSITQSAQAQAIACSVTDGTNPVPYASVLLLVAGGDGDFVLGVVANGAGQCTVNAPVGTYQVVAVKAGYVTVFETAPTVALAAGTIPAQNLQMTMATTTISGTVTDAISSAGLGGVQLFVGTEDDLVTVISTAADGTFVAPVTAGQWSIEVSEVSLSQLGYLGPNNDVAADATSGAVTGVNLSLTKATALVHGTVTNSSATPLAGIRVSVGDTNNIYYTDATTDSNGYYVMGVTTGTWNTHVSNESPGLAGYVVPNHQNVTITGAQAVQTNFVLLAVNAHLQGVVTNNGVPVSGIVIGAYNQSTDQFIMVATAPDGTFDLGLVAGTWTLQFESSSAVDFNIVSSSVEYTLAEDQTISGITMAVLSATSRIEGYVRDSNSQPISANVYANATIGGVLYTTNSQTDSSGYYGLPVTDGSWQVGVSANDFTNPNPVTAIISGSDTTINFTLTKAPVITYQPVDQTVIAGQTFVFSVNLDGSDVSFQWQASTDGGSNWSDLTNGSTYSGTTTTVLDVTSNLGLDGNRYRCIATNPFGSAISNSALLTVNAPDVAPAITAQPSNKTVTAGQNASFTVVASGMPAPAYQWQLSTDSGFNWSNLANNSPYSGVDTDILTVTATATAQNGYRFRAVATNVAGSATSNHAILTVNMVPYITTQSSNQTVTAGQNAIFTVAASGMPAPTYQWQLSTDAGLNWSNLANNSTYSGVDTNILAVTATATDQNGYRFRAVATNVAGSTTSNSALLTVNEPDVAPGITTQPSNQTVTAGQNAAFTVAASGTPAPTYQWQLSTDAGFNWSNLPNNSTYSGVDTNILTVTATANDQNGYRFRAVATNAAGSATSNGAMLTVTGTQSGTPTFVPTGSLVDGGRYQHAAVLLNDGRVFVAGGYVASSTKTSAEIYDPALCTWSLTGPMSIPRAHHTANLLPDGRVLVAGGLNGAPVFASTEIWNPATGGFTWGTPMGVARAYHHSVELSDGKILVTGGTSISDGALALAAAEIYDPSNGTWTPTGSMVNSRNVFAAVRLADGRVLITGGSKGREDGYNSMTACEIYNPSSGTFTSASPMAKPRNYHAAVLLDDGRVLVAGGNWVSGGQNLAHFDAEIYDPNTNAWTSAGQLTAGGIELTLTRVADGRVLAAGGRYLLPTQTVMSAADLFDPVTNTFSPLAPMNVARSSHSATLLGNGSVLLAGGISSHTSAPNATATAELFMFVSGITSQPSDQTAAVGQNALFTIAVGGIPTPTFQWQVSINNGSTWNNLLNNSIYGGVNLTTLTVTANADLTGYLYRCVVSGGTATSNAAILTVTGSAITNWRQLYFGDPSNSGDGADTATPDHDGIPNLIKYGLVIVPGSSGVHALPSGQIRTYAEGQRLALIFTRDPARNDITLHVQAANSLAGPWGILATSTNGSAFTGTGFVSETNASGDLKTVETRDTQDMSGSPRRFMRIEVKH